MGNKTDYTTNQTLMSKHSSNHMEFVNSNKLFHSKDIKFPLSTKNALIVDANGKRVKLSGTNWSGGHMCRHCVDGL